MKISKILFWGVCGYYALYLLAILVLMAFEIPATSMFYTAWGFFSGMFMLITLSFLLWNYWDASKKDLNKVAITSLVLAFGIFAIEFAFQSSIQSFENMRLVLVLAYMVVTVATGYMSVYAKEN